MKFIAVFLTLMISTVCAVDADQYWGQWHGPADGRACLASGSAGADLELAYSIDLDKILDSQWTSPPIQPDGNRYPCGLTPGILVRADDRFLYLKENKDYYPAKKVLWKIDPSTGTSLWSTDTQSALEDMSNPRGFQLYNDPRGFNSIHVPPYYNCYWDVLRLDSLKTEKLIGGEHACLGARVLMGKWAWRNQIQYGAFCHLGDLLYWNGTQYAQRSAESLQVLDHAWEDSRCVIFVLSGWQDSIRYKESRFLVLDTGGAIIQDSRVGDIHRPLGASHCYYDTTNSPGAMAGIPDTADILMKLAVKGDYVYAVERATFDQRQLVRRCISEGFVKTDSIVLGTDPLLSNTSYCVNDSGLYLQGTDTLTAYSLDLRTVRWKRSIPHRTLFHVFVQGISRSYTPGLKNFIHHSLACDPGHVYNVSDSCLLVIDANTGTTLFSHVFTDLPERTCPYMYYGREFLGPAGTVTLLPDYVVVNSVLVCSQMWIFRNKTTSSERFPADAWAQSGPISVWPNPFNPEMKVSYRLKTAQVVQLSAYDASGRLVFRKQADRKAGSHVETLRFDGLSSGLYLVQTTIDGKTLNARAFYMR